MSVHLDKWNYGSKFGSYVPALSGSFYGYGFGFVLLCHPRSVSTPEGSPLGQILTDWSTYSYNPMTKRELAFYCNTACPMYTLYHGGKWPLNGSLDYYTIIQLELLC